MIVAPTKVAPSFINIGPGRCATSWLLTALTAHPQIQMSRVKETEFFNTHFDKGTQWYEQHFESDSAAVGEISNNYYLDSQVADRIHEYDSNIKLVINVRNPYSLLQSYYSFGLRRGLQLGTLTESLNSPVGQIMGSGFDSRRKKNCLTAADQMSLLDSVCLADRLLPFGTVFPPAQIHFFVFERLAKDYRGALRDLYGFLGVDAAFEPENADKIINSSVQPKSRMLARMATRSASLLRQAGAYGLLSKLHQSEWLKMLLFSRKSAGQVESIKESLPKEVISVLDNQIAKLKDRYPMVAAGWSE